MLLLEAEPSGAHFSAMDVPLRVSVGRERRRHGKRELVQARLRPLHLAPSSSSSPNEPRTVVSLTAKGMFHTVQACPLRKKAVLKER